MQTGKTYFEVRIEYADSADLADKLRLLADSIDGDKALIVDKERWLDRAETNWGGDGP